MHLSLPPQTHERHNSRCDLRPPQPRHIATPCKNGTPVAPTTDTSHDLKFTKEIIIKLNIRYHDQNMQQDDNHLSMIDEHPLELLAQWTKQSKNTNNRSETQPTTQSAKEVHDPVSGAYLECRELLKTKERQNSFANELGRL